MMNNFDLILTKYLEKHGIFITAENATQMNDEDFAKIRYDGFGASDSSRILNVNPFPGGSPEELLNDKINRVHDDSIGKKANVRMGKDLEDFIISKLTQTLGVSIHKPNHMYGKDNGLNTNFDGVIMFNNGDEWIPIEVKTISMYGTRYYDFNKGICIIDAEGNVLEDSFSKIFKQSISLKYFEGTINPKWSPLQQHIHHNADEAGIPSYYYTQLQQQIDFLKSSRGYLAALNVKDWSLYLFPVPHDDVTIRRLNSKALILNNMLKEARENEKL